MQSFSELPLSPELLRAVKEMGFETPSPIQAEALPVLLDADTDFLGLAGTGTGKTATFAIPLLEKLDPSIKAVQALILCPTRELAVQVAGQVDLLGKYKGLRSLTIYGGAPYNEQLRGLSRGAQIVVGTPGRVIDHLERGSLKLDQIKVLILDEADEMFSMGFKEELDAVIEAMPEEGANTWLFSATMSPEVRRIVDRNLHDPKTVQVNRKEMLSSGVEQYFYKCQESEKPHIISSLIEAAEDFYGVIFCQTKALVQDLTVFLMDRGYKVDSLHGDKDQNSREKTMQAFRDRKLQVLVCTDVAARGLDVKDITHVINYSLPRELDSYVHRIGRTARSGKTGYAMNLVTFSHRHLLTRIEAFTKVRMTEGFVPTAREIGAKKVEKLLPKLIEQKHGERVLEVMGEEFKTQLASMTVEDVASKFIAMMMADVFGQPARREKGAARPGARAEERGERYERRERSAAPARSFDRGSDRGQDRSERGAERYERPAAGSTRPGGELNPERGGIPRSQMQFRKQQDSNVVEAMDLDVASILDEAPLFGVQSESPRSERFDRAPRFERAPRGESSRPGGFERSERPARAAKPARVEGGLKSRHAAPGKTNWTKTPRHDAGSARPSRHVEETPVLNRRARRAAKFAGQPTF